MYVCVCVCVFASVDEVMMLVLLSVIIVRVTRWLRGGYVVWVCRCLCSCLCLCLCLCVDDYLLWYAEQGVEE